MNEATVFLKGKYYKLFYTRKFIDDAEMYKGKIFLSPGVFEFTYILRDGKIVSKNPATMEETTISNIHATIASHRLIISE